VTVDQQSSARHAWLPTLKIGTLVTGVLAIIGLIADLPTVFNLPVVWFAGFALTMGVAILFLGAVLFGREWSKPLGWPATRAAMTAALGLPIIAVSLMQLRPGLDTRPTASTMSQAPTNQVPITLSDGTSFDVDPREEGSESDFKLDNGAITRPYRYHTTMYLRVKDGSLSSCSSPTNWVSRLKAVAGTFICVTSDQRRFVNLEILSVSGDSITFRQLAAGTPSNK